MRSYLLGQLNDQEEALVEQRLLSDDELFGDLEVIENELMDQYVQGDLSAEEKRLMEKRLLQNPQERRKLIFATVLDEESTAHAKTAKTTVSIESRSLKRSWPTGNFWKIAAVLVIAVGLTITLWLLLGRKSSVSRGMVALNQAYRSERLVESRISQMDYSPLRQRRGGEPSNIDALARDQAQLLLVDAVRNSRNAASLHALGRLYLAEKKFDRAREYLEEALKLDANNPQIHSDLAATFLELGATERSSDEGKAAESFGKSLEHVSRALDLNGSLLEALFNRALLLEQLLLLPRAEEAWRSYLQKDSTSPWAEEARRHLKLVEEQNKKALESRGAAYERFVSAYHRQDRETVWTTIAQNRSRMGNQIVERLVTEYLDFAAQKNEPEAATRLAMLTFAGKVEAEEVGDLYTSELASFYSNTSENQRKQLTYARSLCAAGLKSYNESEFDKAIEFYMAAWREFIALRNSPEALFAESWIGYSELRRDGMGARERFERLAAIYEQKHFKSLQAQSIHALSDAWTDENELSKVLNLASRALEISETIRDDSTRLRCLQQFVSVNLRFGRYLDSLRYGLVAIRISQSFMSEPKLVWTFYHELALNFQWLGLPVAALEFENRALELAKQSAWTYIIVRSYTQLGLIYERQGDFNRAISNGLQALAEGQKVQDEKSRLSIVSHATMRLAHLYRHAGDFNSALAHYDSALRMFEQLDLGVFRYETHKGKFIALLGANDVAAADNELQISLELFERYRAKIQEERNRNSFFDVDQDIYDLAITFALTKQNDAVRAFDYAEQSRARSLLGYLSNAPRIVQSEEGPDLQHELVTRALSFDELRHRLPPGKQILQYSVGDEQIIAWIITRDGLTGRLVRYSKKQLDENVSTFVEELRRGAITEATITTAKQLYAVLIDDLESLLDRNKQLYIVPDKILVRLPFAALISPNDGKFLVEKYVLAFAPSTNVFLACTDSAQRKTNVETERALTVGNPSFSRIAFPDLPNLPSAEHEAREVASCYTSDPLLGANAREKRVKSGMSTAEVVHLASHFVIDPRSPMLSKLLLASETSEASSNSDGVLQVSEVYDMKLPHTRLVVLPACQTGVERTYQGEGAMSIARAFISSGVPLVVATLWPVESDATSHLMVLFHRYRKLQGLSTVEALRQAQLDMIKSTEQSKNSPNAWASFVTIGGYAPF